MKWCCLRKGVRPRLRGAGAVQLEQATSGADQGLAAAHRLDGGVGGAGGSLVPV